MTARDEPENPRRPALRREDVEHVATLAALSLGEGEAETMTRDLAAIVGYIEQLAELDTSDVPPTAMVVEMSGSALRADDVVPSLPREEALAQAPRSGDEGFLVPGFVDGAS
jgi:aspartyl-tRNA(Asn)/glutamyl-tRNA(Gln) amidotransferase subunit C